MDLLLELRAHVVPERTRCLERPSPEPSVLKCGDIPLVLLCLIRASSKCCFRCTLRSFECVRQRLHCLNLRRDTTLEPDLTSDTCERITVRIGRHLEILHSLRLFFGGPGTVAEERDRHRDRGSENGDRSTCGTDSRPKCAHRPRCRSCCNCCGVDASGHVPEEDDQVDGLECDEPDHEDLDDRCEREDDSAVLLDRRAHARKHPQNSRCGIDERLERPREPCVSARKHDALERRLQRTKRTGERVVHHVAHLFGFATVQLRRDLQFPHLRRRVCKHERRGRVPSPEDGDGVCCGDVGIAERLEDVNEPSLRDVHVAHLQTHPLDRRLCFRGWAEQPRKDTPEVGACETRLDTCIAERTHRRGSLLDRHAHGIRNRTGVLHRLAKLGDVGVRTVRDDDERVHHSDGVFRCKLELLHYVRREVRRFAQPHDSRRCKVQRRRERCHRLFGLKACTREEEQTVGGFCCGESRGRSEHLGLLGHVRELLAARTADLASERHGLLELGDRLRRHRHDGDAAKDPERGKDGRTRPLRRSTGRRHRPLHTDDRTRRTIRTDAHTINVSNECSTTGPRVVADSDC